VPGGGHDPGAWLRGTPARRPLLERDGEGFLDRFLGGVEVAHEPDHAREDPSELVAVEPLDLRALHGRCRDASRPVHDPKGESRA
jgi:hypothetical protein